MSTTSTVFTDGAELTYDIEGTGPLLLLVAGGNGESMRFAPLSAHLANRYTVIKYDRRANGRSGGDKTAEMSMAQAGRDAAAIIEAAGRGKAFVFGNSAGANIALQLTQAHPQLVRGAVIHEPPVSDFLPEPDASKWRAFFDNVYAVFLAEGAGPAMRLFATTMVGFERNVLAAPGDQAGGDHERFLAHEFRHINSFLPDLTALRNGAVPLAMAVGRASTGAFYAQTAHELAKQLPCPCAQVVGNHLGYAFEAEQFANDLDLILKGFPRASE
ncbi:alpha/beta hydrolase family protein [Pseudomonas baetica]|uniref:Alpha/beta hydrolase family protein n=1 Tax=Pseudomonas baetica TaxID=674054 RepID=A0ABX4PTG9_9PSED|nr:alpha/beta fold hydrolase [Pseudomonas baetica]PKA68163.1 alpha/beta hydrolase family protein [Pseudomonas baetica]